MLEGSNVQEHWNYVLKIKKLNNVLEIKTIVTLYQIRTYWNKKPF